MDICAAVVQALTDLKPHPKRNLGRLGIAGFNVRDINWSDFQGPSPEIHYLDSLTWSAFEAAVTGGPANSVRYVIPRVAGTITVPTNEAELLVDNIIYLGHLGPGQGIELVGNSVVMRALNAIFFHIAFRPGDGSDADNRDGFFLRNRSSGATQFFALYNCSVQGGCDEILSVDARSNTCENVSFVDCIFGYALNTPNHPKSSDNHSYGPYILDGGWAVEFARCVMQGFKFRVPAVELGSYATSFSCYATEPGAGISNVPFTIIEALDKSIGRGIYDTGVDSAWNVLFGNESRYTTFANHRTSDGSSDFPRNQNRIDRNVPFDSWRDGDYSKTSLSGSLTRYSEIDPKGNNDWWVNWPDPNYAPNHDGFNPADGDPWETLKAVVGKFPADLDGMDQLTIDAAEVLDWEAPRDLPSYSITQITSPQSPVTIVPDPFALETRDSLTAPKLMWQANDEQASPRVGGIPFLTEPQDVDPPDPPDPPDLPGGLIPEIVTAGQVNTTGVSRTGNILLPTYDGRPRIVHWQREGYNETEPSLNLNDDTNVFSLGPEQGRTDQSDGSRHNARAFLYFGDSNALGFDIGSEDEWLSIANYVDNLDVATYMASLPDGGDQSSSSSNQRVTPNPTTEDISLAVVAWNQRDSTAPWTVSGTGWSKHLEYAPPEQQGRGCGTVVAIKEMPDPGEPGEVTFTGSSSFNGAYLHYSLKGQPAAEGLGAPPLNNGSTLFTPVLTDPVAPIPPAQPLIAQIFSSPDGAEYPPGVGGEAPPVIGDPVLAVYRQLGNGLEPNIIVDVPLEYYWDDIKGVSFQGDILDFESSDQRMVRLSNGDWGWPNQNLCQGDEAQTVTPIPTSKVTFGFIGDGIVSLNISGVGTIELNGTGPDDLVETSLGGEEFTATPVGDVRNMRCYRSDFGGPQGNGAVEDPNYLPNSGPGPKHSSGINHAPETGVGPVNEELIINGDFETGTTDPWEPYNASGEAYLSVVNGEMLIENRTSGGNATALQPIATVIGETYIASGMARPDGPGDPTIRFKENDVNGATLASIKQNDDGTVEFVATTTTTMVDCSLFGQAANRRAYFDDITCRARSTGEVIRVPFGMPAWAGRTNKSPTMDFSDGSAFSSQNTTFQYTDDLLGIPDCVTATFGANNNTLSRDAGSFSSGYATISCLLRRDESLLYHPNWRFGFRNVTAGQNIGFATPNVGTGGITVSEGAFDRMLLEYQGNDIFYLELTVPVPAGDDITVYFGGTGQNIPTGSLSDMGAPMIIDARTAGPFIPAETGSEVSVGEHQAVVDMVDINLNKPAEMVFLTEFFIEEAIPDSRIVEFSDQTQAERILLILSNDLKLHLFIHAGGVTQLSQSITADTPTLREIHYCAVRIREGDLYASYDGGAETLVGSIGDMPQVNWFEIGHGQSVTSDALMGDAIRAVVYGGAAGAVDGIDDAAIDEMAGPRPPLSQPVQLIIAPLLPDMEGVFLPEITPPIGPDQPLEAPWLEKTSTTHPPDLDAPLAPQPLEAPWLEKTSQTYPPETEPPVPPPMEVPVYVNESVVKAPTVTFEVVVRPGLLPSTTVVHAPTLSQQLEAPFLPRTSELYEPLIFGLDAPTLVGDGVVYEPRMAGGYQQPSNATASVTVNQNVVVDVPRRSRAVTMAQITVRRVPLVLRAR